MGFELRRDLEVTERFTLGEGRSRVAAVLWDRAVVRCCSARPGVRIILFGVENAADLKRADRLGVYAVMTDSPRTLKSLLRR